MRLTRFIYILLFVILSSSRSWGQLRIPDYKLFIHRYILAEFDIYDTPEKKGICTTANALVEPDIVLDLDKSNEETFIHSLYAKAHYTWFSIFLTHYDIAIYHFKAPLNDAEYTTDHYDRLMYKFMHQSSVGYFNLNNGNYVEFKFIDIQGVFLSHDINYLKGPFGGCFLNYVDFRKYPSIKEIVIPFRIDVYRETTTLFF